MEKEYSIVMDGDTSLKTVYVDGKRGKLHGFNLRPISGMNIAETFGKIEYMDGTIDMVHSKRIKFNL